MNRINTNTLITLLLITGIPLSAQFRHNSPAKRIDYKKPAAPSIQLLDRDKLSIDHSFSLSMSSVGGQSFSYGVYSNRLQYLISNKWSLRTDLNFIQPTFSSLPSGVNTYQGQVQYGVQLQYQPSENFLFQVGIDNYPRYSRYGLNSNYSPFFYNNRNSLH